MDREEKNPSRHLNKWVFFPPWLALLALVSVCIVDEAAFVRLLDGITGWILDNFAWAFNGTTLLCVVLVATVYFSPLGNVRIGGKNAVPMLKFWAWVWITLCTTIAAGILFWACAEPLYHFHQPPASEGIAPGSKTAALFAMKTMFLEWTWSPYALYTVATVVFAFVFYNMRKPYSLGSVCVPLLGDRVLRYSRVIDCVCLFALVTGMAASLGTGTMTLAGGLENILGWKSAPLLWAVVMAVIVLTFVVSSVSGVIKGIRILSNINARVYFVLLAFMLVLGPTSFILNFSTEAFGAYLADFPRLSLMTGEAFEEGWAKSWPVFYWCNWLAWTPIAAAFLARISVGYTVRQVIKCNFIIPAVFSTIWMAVFSSSALFYEFNGLELHAMIKPFGPESVVYKVFEQIPFSSILIPFYVFIVFISFVTASDSNTNAMAALCTQGISDKDQEGATWLKIVWGVTLAAVSWIMIATAGIDGIKQTSNLGGFLNMFLMLAMAFGLLKICFNPRQYDSYKEDYL